MAGFLGLGSGEGSVFLDPDDAKTMGDIDYMRTPKKIKRTFAKSKGWGEVSPSEKIVSAYDEKGGAPMTGGSTPSFARTPSYFAPSTPSYSAPATPTYSAPSTISDSKIAAPAASSTSAPEAAPSEFSAPAPKAAAAGDEMDMFRAMARKIR
jgi:hypothetical protein